MCWGDVSSDLQTVHLDEGENTPESRLDSASRHKCRDFDAIARWTQNHAVKAVRMDDLWWGGRVLY